MSKCRYRYRDRNSVTILPISQMFVSRFRPWCNVWS